DLIRAARKKFNQSRSGHSATATEASLWWIDPAVRAQLPATTQDAEAGVIESELRGLLSEFRRTGAWERLKCVELIFVLGWANKDVARRLNLTELAVANHKYFVVQKLREAGRAARVSSELLSAVEPD
ncbi:MAG: hypothetical protein ACK48R_11220, partial [Planctomyces sp.]